MMKAKDVINDIHKLVANKREDDALTILETYHDDVCKEQREECASPLYGDIMLDSFAEKIRRTPKPEFK